MDFLFHHSKIKKFITMYQKPYYHRLKILMALLIIHFSLMAAMIVFIMISLVGIYIPIAVFTGYSVFAIYNYVKIYQANKICKEEFYHLIAAIVRDDQEIDLEYLKNYPRYRQAIKDTRLVHNYDAIGVYKVFKFAKAGITGCFIDVSATRSQGNSSVTILKGLVYIFDMDCSTNMQIRNDPYKGVKCQKEKELSSNTYSVYSFDEQKNFAYSPSYGQKFGKIDRLSPQGVTAIDFQNNKISVYVKRKNTLKIPREMNDVNITSCCDELVDMVGLGRDIGVILARY